MNYKFEHSWCFIWAWTYKFYKNSLKCQGAQIFSHMFCRVKWTTPWTVSSLEIILQNCLEATLTCIMWIANLELQFFLLFSFLTKTGTGNNRTEWCNSRLRFCMIEALLQVFCPFKGCPTDCALMESAKTLNGLKECEGLRKGSQDYWRKNASQHLLKRMVKLQVVCMLICTINCILLLSDCIHPYAKLRHPVALGSLSGSALAEEGERDLYLFHFWLPVPSGGPQSRRGPTNSLFLPQLVSPLIA